MEVVGSVATILQLVSFTGDVLLAGYSYLSSVKKAPTEIRTILREIANLNALLDQLQSVVSDHKNVHAKGALESLDRMGVFGDCEKLTVLVLKSIKTCEKVQGEEIKNLGKKMLWPFKEKETREMMQQLGRLRETLSAAVAVDSV
jgi:hypothetical protein